MDTVIPTSLAEDPVMALNEMDRRRVGTLLKDSADWNISGAPRIAVLYREILKQAQKQQLQNLSVLNMSGLNEGKPDPVLFDLISKRFGKDALSWSIVDHPMSETFTNPTIRGWLDERGIKCIAQDFRRTDFSVASINADVVICTEIAEHLDYSVFVTLLRRCREALRPGGRIIITTPNAVFIRNRIMFALGYWNFLHHMDSPDDVDRGLVGHTIYYDKHRLTRLLSALSFTNIEASTFNCGHGPGEYRNALRRIAAISLRGASRIVPNSGQVLLVTAERS